MSQIQTYPTKADARQAVRSINWHYLQQGLPPANRGSKAPPDRTDRYLLLEQYADGSWGHVVDDYVRSLNGQTIGQSPQHVVDVSGERAIPAAVYDGASQTITTPLRLADIAGSDPA